MRNQIKTAFGFDLDRECWIVGALNPSTGAYWFYRFSSLADARAACLLLVRVAGAERVDMGQLGPVEKERASRWTMVEPE